MVREVVPGTGDGQGGGSWRWSAMAMVREVVREVVRSGLHRLIKPTFREKKEKGDDKG